MSAAATDRPTVPAPTPGRAREFPRKPAMLRPDQPRFHPRNVRRVKCGS